MSTPDRHTDDTRKRYPAFATDAPAAILAAGSPAPDFELPRSPRERLALADLLGRPAVLVFYPADWSPTCGSEMNLYSSLTEEFAPFDAQLFGISVDGPWSHQAYARENNVPFPLLADFEPKGAVARRFGVYREKGGTAERALFVLDPEGRVRWSHLSDIRINPGAAGLLGALEALRDGHDPAPENPKRLVEAVNPERDHVRGSADAPVTLVEYGDYECPFCHAAFPVVEALRERFGPDRLRFAFRHFPLTSAHPQALRLARAAEAAGAQGRFWEMHDCLFTAQGASADLAGVDGGTETTCARRLGLDLARFAADCGDEAASGRLRADVRAGARSGVNGTPTFFVNGERFDGEPAGLAETVAGLLG